MPTTNRTTRAPSTRATRQIAPRRAGGSRSKGSNNWMWWVGGVVLSLTISLVFKLSNKSTDDKEVRGEMIEVVHDFPDYAENSSYYTQLIDRYHHEAFEAAYSMGGRHTAAKIDAKLYLVQISSRMAAKASADGKSSVAKTLMTFNQGIQAK
jgi:hypothetical protein